MRTDYSNIRYHIYRELSKIQQRQKDDRSQLIDEITVPIFSGVISTCVAGYIEKEVSNMILFVPIISLFFLIFLFISKGIVYIYRNRIKPLICPLKDQSRIAQKLEAESLATTYTEIQKKDNRQELKDLKLLDTCFYVDNVIRKLQESLLSYPYPLDESYVSKNKIEAVMNVIYTIINELRAVSNLPTAYEAEIDRVQIKYDDTLEAIGRMYELKLKPFKR